MEEEKNSILIMLLFLDIGLQPEASSPPVSESSGGLLRVTDGQMKKGRKTLCRIHQQSQAN